MEAAQRQCNGRTPQTCKEVVSIGKEVENKCFDSVFGSYGLFSAKRTRLALVSTFSKSFLSGIFFGIEHESEKKS